MPGHWWVGAKINHIARVCAEMAGQKLELRRCWDAVVASEKNAASPPPGTVPLLFSSGNGTGKPTEERGKEQWTGHEEVKGSERGKEQRTGYEALKGSEKEWKEYKEWKEWKEWNEWKEWKAWREKIGKGSNAPPNP